MIDAKFSLFAPFQDDKCITHSVSCLLLSLTDKWFFFSCQILIKKCGFRNKFSKLIFLEIFYTFYGYLNLDFSSWSGCMCVYACVRVIKYSRKTKLSILIFFYIIWREFFLRSSDLQCVYRGIQINSNTLWSSGAMDF